MTTFWITGAHRGIGWALVRTFSAHGDRVIAVCRSAPDALSQMKVPVIAGCDAPDAASPARWAAQRGVHQLLFDPMKRLSMADSGKLVHAHGERLPW